MKTFVLVVNDEKLQKWLWVFERLPRRLHRSCRRHSSSPPSIFPATEMDSIDKAEQRAALAEILAKHAPLAGNWDWSARLALRHDRLQMSFDPVTRRVQPSSGFPAIPAAPAVYMLRKGCSYTSSRPATMIMLEHNPGNRETARSPTPP